MARQTQAQRDEVTARLRTVAAEHAEEEGHRTVLCPGHGWLCEQCDDDLPDFLSGEWAGLPTE